MTKKVVKIATVVCLVLSLSAGAFAQSVYFSTAVESSGAPVLPLVVETPKVILDWFEDEGFAVDNYSTDTTGMPVEYRNEVKELYSDNKGSLDAIAQKVLLPYLEKGSVEYVITGYGPITWTVQYKQGDEKEFSEY